MSQRKPWFEVCESASSGGWRMHNGETARAGMAGGCNCLDCIAVIQGQYPTPDMQTAAMDVRS